MPTWLSKGCSAGHQGVAGCCLVVLCRQPLSRQMTRSTSPRHYRTAQYVTWRKPRGRNLPTLQFLPVPVSVWALTEMMMANTTLRTTARRLPTAARPIRTWMTSVTPATTALPSATPASWIRTQIAAAMPATSTMTTMA